MIRSAKVVANDLAWAQFLIRVVPKRTVSSIKKYSVKATLHNDYNFVSISADRLTPINLRDINHSSKSSLISP